MRKPKSVAKLTSRLLKKRENAPSKGVEAASVEVQVQAAPVEEQVQAVPVEEQVIHIRVYTAMLQQNQLTVTDPSGQHSSRHLYLITGTFEDIARFAGTTVDWIIKIAHLLCDPLGAGHVYTHTTGMPSDWYSLDRTPSWREVVRGDQLLPGIYEFEATHPIVLSKISDRQSRSVTTAGSKSSASTFHRHTLERDAGCVVTRQDYPLVASHLIPRRIGSEGIKATVERFVGVNGADGYHIFDPRIGITLFISVDSWVDSYQAGFYRITNENDTYTVHNFSVSHPDSSYVGTSLPNLSVPPLHQYPVTLSVHAGGHSLPPPGVFDWHYMQCVIKRFGTPEYKGLPDIKFLVCRFRTASDSSDDESSGDFDANPPYPSYRFERSLQQQLESHRAQEHRKEILQWASGVLSGISVHATQEEVCKEGNGMGIGEVEE